RLIDAATGHDRAVLPRGDAMFPTQVEFMPGGRTVMAAYSDHLLECDVDTGRTLRRIAYPAGCEFRAFTDGLAISPEGKRLAVASKFVPLLDRSSGRETSRFPVPGRRRIESLAFSPDGRLLVTSDEYSPEDRDGPSVRVWDLSSGKVIRWLASI